MAVLLLGASVSAQGQQMVLFTPAEQQQVSIATPGIFAKGSSFTIDFDTLKDADYSFPLPVGKAVVVDGRALDITTAKGDAVKAMFDGVVRLSRKLPQYGNTVVIRHDNGLETMYANNAQNLVGVGRRIKAGQSIAIVGADGDRYLCHFAFMVNGGWINPSIIVDPGSHRLRSGMIECRQTGSHVRLSSVRAPRPSARSLDPDDFSDDPFEGRSIVKLNLGRIEEERWAYPLPGSHVISPYGGRRNHSGVDVKTQPNDKIVAAFDGVVTRSSPYSGYGNCIVIRHAYGFETLYSHQSKNLVRVGQKVRAGEVIGLTGKTGRATTEHLHFEVKFRGRRLNPAVLFDHGRRMLRKVTLTLTKAGGVR